VEGFVSGKGEKPEDPEKNTMDYLLRGLSFARVLTQKIILAKIQHFGCAK
jgi:hypothetical protein